MDLNLLQWPAMAVTVVAAWLVASQSKKKRTIGFLTFIASNVLWVIWGVHDNAYAVIALQVCLGALNVRGVVKNEPTKPTDDKATNPTGDKAVAAASVMRSGE